MTASVKYIGIPTYKSLLCKMKEITRHGGNDIVTIKYCGGPSSLCTESRIEHAAAINNSKHWLLTQIAAFSFILNILMKMSLWWSQHIAIHQ